jgi:hypothetical protein
MFRPTSLDHEADIEMANLSKGLSCKLRSCSGIMDTTLLK